MSLSSCPGPISHLRTHAGLGSLFLPLITHKHDQEAFAGVFNVNFNG